jgi:alkylation response protein AidB-like acyl-CoA dehydrogenase
LKVPSVVRRQPAGLGWPDDRRTPGLAHPLAHAAVQIELARLMIAKAAALYDAGRDLDAGTAANMAKYASAEAAALAVDTVIQVHDGNGMTTEYGVAPCSAPYEPPESPRSAAK